MGFPLPLADYVAPLASIDFFAGGFCEQELGLSRRGLERLLDGWQRWVHAFFGLVTLEIWGRHALPAAVGRADRRADPPARAPADVESRLKHVEPQ